MSSLETKSLQGLADIDKETGFATLLHLKKTMVYQASKVSQKGRFFGHK